MAESYNPPPVERNQAAEDNEPRIDGDGQEVNALRFLGAGGPAPAPPPPAITPVTSGVSQPLQPQHQQQQPQPPQAPLQSSQPPQQHPLQHPQQPMAPAGGYDYPDPSSGYNSMQMTPGAMPGPYGMPGQVPGAPMMGGAPMMMMPPYNYMPYPPPYYMPGAYAAMPTAPSANSAQFLEYLKVVRVQDPKFYREWYKKYSAHKRNPDRVPFPQIPGFPNFGPGSSQTLPSSYGRSRKESTRSSVNGDYKHHNESFSNLDYSHVPGGGANTSMSSYRRGDRQSRSGRTSVNGDYRPPEDFYEIDGADMTSLSGAGGNSMLQTSHYHERDRPQTQSGRSSTVGESVRLPPGDVYGEYSDQQPDSLGYDPYGFKPIQEQVREPSPRRMTPMKFSTFHSIAALSPLGHLVRIKSGTVLEFVKLKQFVGHLPEYKEMELFPGPLTQDSTHKNTVIQFCRRKIKEARSNAAQVDKENYILLWEFLMLMLRQNGMVVGSDVAELLLNAVQEEKKVAEIEEVRDDVEGKEDEGVEVSPVEPPVVEPRDEEKLVKEFCEHLLYGHKKDALDFAMDNGLWGHALFFASKMDERSYGHVLARFANGIALNSPLQTLYHVMCGKQPASVTSCADESFGDWKPHLAMLLSNNGYKPQVEHKAILTLGDTLASRNHIYAAQFCYLMGHEEFRKDSRLGPLLGYSATAENILEATQMSEVYEFARKLADPHFSLGLSFLQSKLEYSKTLVSYGFVQEALAYCEDITKTLKSRKIEDAEVCLCKNTLQIAERIALADESDSANTTWVEDLRRIIAEPSTFCESLRKLSLVSSQEQGSDQMSYTSQQQPMPNADMYDPYSNQQGQVMLPPDLAGAPRQYDPNASTPISNSDAERTFSGVGGSQPENNWNNSGQMNGGLHLSAPVYDINQQSQVSANPTNVYGSNPEYPSMDGGYGPGYASDKLAAAPTSNNNYWYNPYDSQPAPHNNDYSVPSNEPDHFNNTAVKKKSVRFEDEHERHVDVENSLGNGTSVLRARIPIRPDTIDLKSAMKSPLLDRLDLGIPRQNVINGGVDTTDKKGLDNSDATEKSLLEVEYKSTYPIDEPIEAVSRLAPNVKQVGPLFEFIPNTYPVDKECCDVNEPCEDHDDYLLGEGNENGGHDMTSHITGYEKTEAKIPPSPSSNAKKPVERKKSGKDDKKIGESAQQKGWFSGLLNFSLKPKNQMILPDDKNPTIVWDEKSKRWTNTAAADGEDDLAPAGPPPKDSELMGMGNLNAIPNGPLPPAANRNPQSVPPSARMPTQPYQTVPAALHNLPPTQSNNHQLSQHQGMNVPPQLQQQNTPQYNNNDPMIPGMPPVSSNNLTNKYKLQKGRSLKNSYVDVLNPNASRTPNDPPAVPVNNIHAPQVPNFFIPPPSNQSGDGPVSFLTAPSEDGPVGSDDSLPHAPPMFNPAQFHNNGYPQGQ